MGDPLQDLLAELLSETPGQTSSRMEAAYRQTTAPCGDKLVIFGTGQLGHFVLPSVRAAGLQPLAFCDNNSRKWGTEISGVPVIAPVEAVKLYADQAFFLTAIYNASTVQRQLRELGCSRIVPYPLLFWKYGRFIPDERLATPRHILEHSEEMAPAYELLADEESRLEFRSQIKWRCLLDYTSLPEHHAAEDMYFPNDLVRLSPDEVYVDCGAFDGDSIRSYLERTAGAFRQIYAFEPDAANICALDTYLATLPADVSRRIQVRRNALGRSDGFVHFNAEGTVGSKVAETSQSVEVECRSLDSALGEDIRPTFIKMDIEGAEVDAILGAARIAERCRPVMAVCAYHRPEHLWIIPQLLRSVNPDYRIFLRRYAEECWETVYYAIPPERLVR